MVSKSDIYIQHILDELKSGIFDRAKVLDSIKSKWDISDSTFDRNWRKAKSIHMDELKAIKQLKDAEYTKEQLEAFKEAILTKQEKQEFLKKVVNGEISVKRKQSNWNPISKKFEIVTFDDYPDFNERMKAIEIDNKMSGDIAVLKTQNENINENRNIEIIVKNTDIILANSESDIKLD
jgi:hypothetical protein